MSHELRSPLNAILGFAQLMESSQPAPTADQMSSLAQILKAGWHLLALINEILDLSLIESGRLSMSLEPVSLAEVLLDCQEMIEPQANGRGIHMHYPVFNSPCFVAADRTRIKQVFVNLLSNAIKCDRKHGTVTVSCRTLDDARLHISVRDTGHGLSAQKLSELFQPFNRLGQEDSGEEGTGIGLVVSKRLVELMGGFIGVRSTVGDRDAFCSPLRVGILQPLTGGIRHIFQNPPPSNSNGCNEKEREPATAVADIRPSRPTSCIVSVPRQHRWVKTDVDVPCMHTLRWRRCWPTQDGVALSVAASRRSPQGGGQPRS